MPNPKDPEKLREYKEKMRQHALRRGFGVKYGNIPVNKVTKIDTIDGKLYKLCPLCKESKPVELFIKNKKTKDGLFNYCKTCKAISDKKSYDKLHKNPKPPKLTKEEKKKRKQESYQKNKKEINKKWAEKRRTDIDVRLINNLRSRLSAALKLNLKTSSTTFLLGCSLEDFKTYMESKFTDGMSWDNYGMYGWHVDHIIPCCKFDLSKEEEQKKCFHFTNLQPLWAKDNLTKNRFVK